MAAEMRRCFAHDLPPESAVLFAPRNHTSRDIAKVSLARALQLPFSPRCSSLVLAAA